MALNDLDKLCTLLDDPEVRELVFGLGHVGSAPHAEAGAPRLHAVVLGLAETTSAEQYGSWLSDDAPNHAMTVDQVWMAIGEGAVGDLADFTGEDASAVAWQLSAVLPDLVDAVSPGGVVIDADRLARELAEAVAEDDRTAGAFGPRVH